MALIDDIKKEKDELKIKEVLALEKAFQSNNVQDIMKAQDYLKTIKDRDQQESKSFLIDPLQLQSSFGYKDKNFSVSYDLLRGMSKTHIVKSIIETRRDQVIKFTSPQKDKYSTGFVVQKKERFSLSKEVKKLTKEEEKKIEYIINFLLDCGTTENFWNADTFDTFIGKLVQDSLTLDQACYEVRRDRVGRPIEFFAVDSGTFRIADTYGLNQQQLQELGRPVEVIKGYTPSYVQIYMQKVMAEFYPWELCFGVRNPQTDVRLNGYGRAELEDMVQTVTAILNSDYYNANFFKVGSSPKGILKYTGNMNQNTVEDFRRQWQAQVAGVANMHKLPMINADKLDFINTHVPNKDMEFSKYQEFLIKITCAMYKIDPSEIGFPMQGSADAKPMFEGNNEARLKYSKDKGLLPLLKKIEYWINKFIVWQIDPQYEFRFVGIEEERTEDEELDMDIKLVSNLQTLNEVRAKRNLEPIENGDMVLNPIYSQAQMMAQQQQQGGEMGDEDQDTSYYQDEDQDHGDENPFTKALENDLERILN